MIHRIMQLIHCSLKPKHWNALTKKHSMVIGHIPLIPHTALFFYLALLIILFCWAFFQDYLYVGFMCLSRTIT